MTRNGAVVALCTLGLLLSLAGPASADHTDPNGPLTPTPEDGVPGGEPAITRGEGEWRHLRNFPNNVASDVTFFTKGGNVYAAQGTLGQGPPMTQYVGQRIIQLMEGGEVLHPPVIRADHGSAACLQPATGVTGLQHDSFATPPDDPQLLIDTTDAVGRCHDAAGGGIELIDISALDDPEFEPREVHLLRFNATTHTATLDAERPWLIFSNNSAFSGNNWLDFADIRSCLPESTGGFLSDDADLDTKRDQCRPEVYRIPFEDQWTWQTVDGGDPDPDSAPTGCHDIVIENNLLYCSGVHAEVILDISDLVDDTGAPRGEPLPCEVIDAEPGQGADTTAMVTDCVIAAGEGDDRPPKEYYEEELGSPAAEGWELVGFYNHPGSEAGNSNQTVPATEGVAISHETRPFPKATTGDRDFILVSDERGGGVVPGGANCTDENFDVYNHSGLHVFDVTDPSNITYATMVDDDGNEARAVWRGAVIQPRPTFCVVHRFRFLEGEQRLIVGYYSQGVKILDYDVDDQGRISFDEVASLQFNSSNTWTPDVFHTVDNPDGTRTYYIAKSDTLDPAGNTFRGMDILTWTAEPNPIGAAAPAPADIDRVSGPGRIETAVEVSKRGYDTANTVVLAREDEYADALAGAPLAAHEDAPILLTYSHRLPEATEAELDRLGARRVIVLGGEDAVSEDVANALRQKLILVERIGGANRFETAALVADELPASDVAFVAEGEHVQDDRGWPDALSAAPYAAFTEQPVLLVNRDRLPPETAQALADRDVTETIVVGGSGAVSDAVVDQIREAVHGPRRVFGSDRYATSAAVFGEALEAGMSVETTWLATGLNWPDALTAGAVAGNEGDALLLVHGRTMDNSPATRDALASHIDDVSLVRLLGGTDAISAGVEAEVAELLERREPPPETEEESPEGDGDGFPFPPLLGLMVLPAAALFGHRRT